MEASLKFRLSENLLMMKIVMGKRRKAMVM